MVPIVTPIEAVIATLRRRASEDALGEAQEDGDVGDRVHDREQRGEDLGGKGDVEGHERMYAPVRSPLARPPEGRDTSSIPQTEYPLADLRAQLEQALGTRYRIERELGGGGMSRVFVAEEVALGRRVAIKVLPAEMASTINQDRFRREVSLSSSLQHPNIVPVLSAEIQDEFLYFIMPFIEGESLRARLAREGELPVSEASRLLREVADALAYAHARGVVHRDIKPDNVMISSGHALVTDFGIAKSLGIGGAESERDDATLTSLGMALGTPTYMAPEQAAGDPHVDHRVDIYALGVMGHEMLAGRPPFAATTPQALLAAHVTQDPEPLRRLRPAVPELLEVLVLRCLAKRPADRPQQATELLPVLESSGLTGIHSTSGPQRLAAPPSAGRVILTFVIGAIVTLALTVGLVELLGLPDWVEIVALVLLAAGLPIVTWATRRNRATSGPLGWLGTTRGALLGGGLAFGVLALGTGGFMALRAMGVGPFATLVSAGKLGERDQLLVADFANSTGDSVLGATLTEALKVDLSQSDVLRLVSPRDITDGLALMQRGDTTALTQDVSLDLATRLGVKAIVVGELSSLGQGYLLTGKVIASSDGSTLYATRATADGAGDVLDALETLSHKLREGIGESFRSVRASPPLEQVTTASLPALQLYTKADRNWSEGQSVDEIALLRQAIALDSNFAMAWRRLAGDLINANGDPATIWAARSRAYALRDRLPRIEALYTVADYLEGQGQFDKVIETYQRILAERPDEKSARNNLGLFLRVVGRYDDAETIMRPAVDSGIAPASTYYNLVTTLIPQGKLDEAQHYIDLLAERMPDSPMRWQVQSYLDFARNDYDGVLIQADSLLSGGPNYRSWAHLYLSEAHRTMGQLRAAEAASRAESADHREQGSPGNALTSAIANAQATLQLLGDTVGAAKTVQALLAQTPLSSLEVMSRPYGNLIRFYAESGDLKAAREVRDEYFAAVPEGMQHGDARGNRGLAALALAEGRPAEALPLARHAALISGCNTCNGNQIADIFEAMGMPDSAIAARESVLRPPAYGSDWDYWRSIEVPIAYRKLGEAYEAKGETSSRRSATRRWSISGQRPTRSCSRPWPRRGSGSRRWRARGNPLHTPFTRAPYSPPSPVPDGGPACAGSPLA